MLNQVLRLCISSNLCKKRLNEETKKKEERRKKREARSGTIFSSTYQLFLINDRQEIFLSLDT